MILYPVLYFTISIILVCILGFFDGFYKIEWYQDTEEDSMISTYLFLFFFWPLIILALIIVALPVYIITNIILYCYNFGNSFNKKLDKD